VPQNRTGTPTTYDGLPAQAKEKIADAMKD